jgi:catalase-peroxidase
MAMIGLIAATVSPSAIAKPHPCKFAEKAHHHKKSNMASYNHKAEPMTPKSNQFWWPDQLDLSRLRQNNNYGNPYGKDFDYKKAFNELDLEAVKADINKLLTDSHDWWPADYGNYGPLFIRMAWHSAGTYRTEDGRGGADGGQQRFEPLNSWPDNGNLDKARRLVWPIKQKYGRSLSWADLIVLSGNVALENMGFKTIGFAGGRADDWNPDLVYWGPETEFMGRARYDKDGKLEKPLGASHMGLIYVNPEGPDGKPDLMGAAKSIRETFGRMAMNDEETVALIAGGHTFGRAHGAHDAKECVGAEPAAADIEAQGFGWHNKCGKGNAEDSITSGLNGAWTTDPVQWTHDYLTQLFNFEWEQTTSPAGAIQWKPKNGAGEGTVPDPHIEGKTHAPIMFTTDLALKTDPTYRKIAKRFLDNPDEFEAAFARAWFKLIHRDMGPQHRYLGKDVPSDKFIWQDPLPETDYALVSQSDIDVLKDKILSSDLTIPQLVRTAWASASSFRESDMRGGPNGARIRLSPQNTWTVNNPKELNDVLSTLDDIRTGFNKNLEGSKQISMADTIVLAGSTAIESAAEAAGYNNVHVLFKPGRVDALKIQTDVESFEVLEPKADGFRNYYSEDSRQTPAEALVSKADMLDLTVPEMTVLLGGMRSLDANYNGSSYGVFTNNPGTLNNDFFVNLLDMKTIWQQAEEEEGIYEGVDRKTGKRQWTGTPVDLIFGSNSELRAVAEVYASSDGEELFIKDFISAWTKVMNLDR